MHAQVVRVHVQAGKADEAIAIWRDQIAPAVRQQKGFKEAYLLVDRSSDGYIGVSLWENAADIAALQSNGFYQEQVAKMAVVFSEPPEREQYEVAAQA